MFDIVLGAVLAAATAMPSFAAEMHQFDVSAEDTQAAIRSFATQAQVQILVAGEQVRDKRLNSVSGNFSTDDALKRFLTGTGLTPQYVSDRAIALVVTPAAGFEYSSEAPRVEQNDTLDRASPADGRTKLKNSNFVSRFLTFLGSALAGISTFAVHAQNAAETTEVALEEIVVTAERRESNVQNTAASISVRSGTQLMGQGKFSLGHILEDIPGISGGAAESFGGALVGTDNAASGLTIRGVGSNAGAGGSTVSVASTAALYVDGVYGGVGRNYDIDRVEVLRGPQGTLYGRSATSGLVAVHTRNPDVERFGGDVSAEFGDYALRHYTGAVNVPIVSDQFAVRVSGNHYERDGYYGYFDPGSGEAEGGKGGGVSTTEGRIKLLYKSNDAFSVLLGAALQNTDLYSGGAALASNATTDPDEAIWQSAPVRKAENTSRQYWAEVNWNLGFATLTYLPAYRTYYQNGVSTSQSQGGSNLGLVNTYVYTPKDHFHTEEIRLVSHPDSKLIWQVGALYYDNDLTNHNTWVYENTALTFSSANIEKSTQAAGAFAQATYPFADAWRLTAGVRYDYTKVATGEDYTFNPGAGQGLNQTLPTVYLDKRDGTRRFNNWTYKLRVEHDLVPSNLVYASISTGFSPGDVSLAQCASFAPQLTVYVCPLVLDAETLTSYEVGSKNRFLDERLQVNGAVFYNDYGAYQDGTYNISGDPNVLAYATLAVPVQVWGAELELLYQLTFADRLGLNAAYANARYVDTPALFAATANANDHLATSPLTSSLSYEHLFTLPGGSTLSLHGDVRYQSAHDGRVLTAEQNANGGASVTRIEAQTVGNLSATWTLANGAFSLTGWVRNVTDERYFNSITIGNSAPPFTLTLDQPTDPRTYGVGANVKF